MAHLWFHNYMFWLTCATSWSVIWVPVLYRSPTMLWRCSSSCWSSTLQTNNQSKLSLVIHLLPPSILTSARQRETHHLKWSLVQVDLIGAPPTSAVSFLSSYWTHLSAWNCHILTDCVAIERVDILGKRLKYLQNILWVLQHLVKNIRSFEQYLKPLCSFKHPDFWLHEVVQIIAAAKHVGKLFKRPYFLSKV